LNYALSQQLRLLLNSIIYGYTNEGNSMIYI